MRNEGPIGFRWYLYPSINLSTTALNLYSVLEWEEFSSQECYRLDCATSALLLQRVNHALSCSFSKTAPPRYILPVPHFLSENGTAGSLRRHTAVNALHESPRLSCCLVVGSHIRLSACVTRRDRAPRGSAMHAQTLHHSQLIIRMYNNLQ